MIMLIVMLVFAISAAYVLGWFMGHQFTLRTFLIKPPPPQPPAELHPRWTSAQQRIKQNVSQSDQSEHF